MKKLKKIMVISIAIVILNIAVLPVMVNLTEIFNFDLGSVTTFLSQITDSAIVKASDTDYQYSGNLLFISDKDQNMPYGFDDFSEGVRIYMYVAKNILEYSVNDSVFMEREYPTRGSKLLNLDKDVNTVEIKDYASQDIVARAVLVKDGDNYIVLQNSKIGWNKGSAIYTLNLKGQKVYEYSIDGGNTFVDIYDLWEYSREYTIAINSGELFKDKIIVRNKNTGNIVYQTPELDYVVENYTYENGKTKVDFANENLQASKTTYEYTINNVTNTGNSFEVEENTNALLSISSEKEFTPISARKLVEISVITVEQPTINVTDDILEITAGEIKNDEPGDIYYSIDGGEYVKYAETVTLDVGTHTVKAYVVSKNKEVKSNEIEKEVTIEEQTNETEENKQEENGSEESGIEDNDVSEDSESNEESSQESAETTSEEVKQEGTETSKNASKSDSGTPKTSDNIARVVIVLSGIILINVIMIYKRRKR